MGEWMNWRVPGWIDEWPTILCWAYSSLNGLFAEAPLGSHLSGPLLLWPASQLPLLLHCSFCNPILLFAQLVQCVFKPPAAIPHSARVALWSITTFCAAVTLRLATSSCNPACQERRSITHGLLRAAKKTQDFAPESVFTRAFTRFRTVTLPNYLMMGGWQNDVVDMMMGMLTMKVFRNSKVFQLNFLRSQVITIVLLVKMPLCPSLVIPRTRHHPLHPLPSSGAWSALVAPTSSNKRRLDQLSSRCSMALAISPPIPNFWHARHVVGIISLCGWCFCMVNTYKLFWISSKELIDGNLEIIQ